MRKIENPKNHLFLNISKIDGNSGFLKTPCIVFVICSISLYTVLSTFSDLNLSSANEVVTSYS